ncbi:MAG: DMT family transporter [Steroidobacteraceae bacterium]
MTYVFLVLTTFFWAAVFHLGKYAVAYLSPLSVAAWRFALAGVVMAAYLAWHRTWDGAAVRRNFWPLVAMGVIGVFGFNAAMFFGLQTTSSVNAALIMSFYPALTAILSAWLNGERILPRQLLGFAISLSGVVLIVSKGSLHNLLTLSFTHGDLLMLVGCACWALYGVMPRRFIRGLPTLLMTTATILVGAILLVTMAAVTADDLLILPMPSVALAIAVMALFGTVLAYLWFNTGIARIGAGRAAIFINLVPLFTTLIGVALGQSVSGAQCLGAVLVIAGVITTASARERGTPAAQPVRA